MNVLEYICIDGDNKFRSKTIFSEKPIEGVDCIITDSMMIENSIVSNGDIVLVPLKCVKNPFIRDDRHWLVFCEYKYPNETNHKNNIRNKLEKVTQDYGDIHLAITQQFVLFKNDQPLGWSKEVDLIKNYSAKLDYSKYSQNIIDELTDAFLYVGINISSFNMERMVGKWSLTLGVQSLLEACDELYLVRYLIQRICYNNNIIPCFISNPYKNSQIYTKCHFAISTPKMREENSLEEIVAACEKLQLKHLEQHKMLCKHNSRKFTYGQNNSQYDVNIVLNNDNSGYIQDKRCAGDCNPYHVLSKIIGTIIVEYSIQTMTHDLNELQDKFNYISSINFNTNKPVIHNNKQRRPLIAFEQTQPEAEKPSEEDLKKLEEEKKAEEKRKKKEEKLAGLSGLARILKMNDDSDEEDDETPTVMTKKKKSGDDNNTEDSGSRVDNIINALKSMNISHNVLQSNKAPKSKSTLKEEHHEPMPPPMSQPMPSMQTQQPSMDIPMVNGMVQPSQNNMMPMQQQIPLGAPNHQLGQPPPPNSLYTLPSQI